MASYGLSDVMHSTLTPYHADVMFFTSNNNNNSASSSNTSEMAGVTPSDNTSVTASVGPSGRGRYGPLVDYPQFWVAWYINRYCLNIITAIGFPGNILSLITILKMKPYSHPSVYVAVLAISDNCCLAVKVIFTELTRHDVDIGSFGCKSLFFLGNIAAIFSNWLLVLMAVERFMAIWFPLKVGALCTGRRTTLALVILLVLVMALCSAFFQITGHKWEGSDFNCVYREEYADFVNFVWYWIDGLAYALLPCVLLVIFNLLIIIGIKRAALIQRQLTEEARSRSKQTQTQAAMEKLRQQRQITLMLVVMCVVFVFLIMPNCVFFIYKPYWHPAPMSEDYANYKCVEQIVFLLSDCSHTVNFFVYFISTKKFRDRFLETVCCCRKWKRRIARTSHVCQSQSSETGSIYITSASNSGVIPLSLRNSGRY